jgi:UrcA family protein
MTRFIPKFPLVGALFGIAAVGAGAAFASPVSEPRQVVHYDAAILSTDAGARALYAKISRAAERVCPNSYSLLAGALVQECRQQAIADAVAKIHNPRLAQVHAAASSKSSG